MTNLKIALAQCRQTDDFDDMLVQLLERIGARERQFVQPHPGQRSVLIGGHPQPHGEHRRIGRTCFILIRQGHGDIEITFQGDNFEGHDKEDQQLKHDVDHRGHLQFDLLLTDSRMANFHGNQLKPCRAGLGSV